MYKIIKFAVKAGLAGGAVYYLADQGVWKESTETTKLFQRITNAVGPYAVEAKAQLPIEIPDLPSTHKVSYLTKQCWNRGVTGAFTYIGDLPTHVTGWTKKGVEVARNNPEIKKFFDSFASKPETTPNVTPAKVTEK